MPQKLKENEPAIIATTTKRLDTAMETLPTKETEPMPAPGTEAVCLLRTLPIGAVSREQEVRRVLLLVSGQHSPAQKHQS